MKRIVPAIFSGVILFLGFGGCEASKKPDKVEPAQEISSAVESGAESASIYGEAPVLAELAAAGELPPVEQRLPANPMVIQPVERIGLYGGTWRMGVRGYIDVSLVRRTIQYEPLVRWDPAWTRVIPNVAQSFEVNSDATEFTFHLREGMRWSDGAPFTAEDIVFPIRDLLENDEYNPSGWYPSWRKSNNIPHVIEAVDRYTVRYRFESPYGFFLQFIAHPDAHWLVPSHYMKQFHPA